MAKLHKELSYNCFKDIPFTLCPYNINIIEELYKYKVATREGELPREFISVHNKIFDDEVKLYKFDSPIGLMYVPESCHDDMIAWAYFETLTPPDINNHSYQFFQVEPGDIVLDGGAFEGLYTHDCLNKGAQKILSIDPLPESNNALSHTFKDNPRVVVCPVALGSHGGDIFFTPRSSASFVDGNMQGGSIHSIRVSVRTIDSLVDEYELNTVDVIKMDVEGSEMDALLGARDTIRRYKPKLVIQTYHKYSSAFMVYKVLTSLRSDYNILLWGIYCRDIIGNEPSYPIKPHALIAW